jgi:hypothetical protein
MITLSAWFRPPRPTVARNCGIDLLSGAHRRGLLAQRRETSLHSNAEPATKLIRLSLAAEKRRLAESWTESSA